jgi:hypothetical protein
VNDSCAVGKITELTELTDLKRSNGGNGGNGKEGIAFSGFFVGSVASFLRSGTSVISL